jgi:peptide deformylase
MAILEILKYPDPRLRTVAEPVTNIDDAFRRTVNDMYETMYNAKGVGLAATQVNIHQRFFVMDVSDERDQPVCIINPEIIKQEGTQEDVHGCLSVGSGMGDKIERAAYVRLRGMDLDGKTIEMDAEGLLAICFQHEIDHLNGILFIDHLSKLKRERLLSKLKKSR